MMTPRPDQQPDLQHLLTLVAGPGESPASEPAGDLERARQALHGRRRRRARYAASALTSLAVATVMVVALVGRTPGGGASGPGADDARPGDRITLVAETLEVAPYVFDEVPVGWQVQGQSPSALTIAPTGGAVSDDPDDFVGKLVVMFDREAMYGTAVEHDGRTFRVAADGDGYTTVAVRTTPGEPRGVLRAQYPDDAGWEVAQMLDFLDGVTLTAEARPGVG